MSIQIFGSLLLSTTQFKEREEEKTDSNLNKQKNPLQWPKYSLNNYLCGLLKAVCQYIIDSCISLAYYKPRDFAIMTNVTVLPPLG